MATKSIFILDCLLALKAELHKTDATRLSHSSPIGGGGHQKDEKGKERESSFLLLLFKFTPNHACPCNCCMIKWTKGNWMEWGFGEMLKVKV